MARAKIAAAILMMLGGAILMGSDAGTKELQKIVPPPTSPMPSLSFLVRDLSLQVWALQTLHELGLTPQQLKMLRAVAPQIAAGDAQADAKVSAKYIATLKALREALLKDDCDQIEDLQDDLDAVRDDEGIDGDDSVTVTDAARAAVPQLMSALTASQVAGYLAVYSDEAPDPLATLMDAAARARKADQTELDALAADTGKEVGILVAGIDPAKHEPVAAKVKEWLQQSRGLSKAQFEAARGDLEKSATALLRDADAFTVLRHWLERDLSELLSNPQLTAVLDARLQRLPAERRD